LDLYALEASTPDDAVAGAARGVFGNFWTGAASDPQQITNTRTRNKHRIVICWTNDTTMTAAQNALTSVTGQALRLVAADGYLTSVKPSFTDGILKFTVTLKFVPYNAAGTGLIRVESTEAANTLTRLESYTSTTTW